MAEAYKNEHEANNHFNVGDNVRDTIKVCNQNLQWKNAKRCKQFANKEVDIYAF